MTYQKPAFLGRSAASFSYILPAALLLVTLGCGPKEAPDPNRATVSGRVTLDGKPLPGGNLLFASVDGKLASTVSVKQGEYSTTRVPLGLNQVTIETESLRFGSPQLYMAIPARYSDPTTSGFEVDVKPGANENVNFELQK